MNFFPSFQLFNYDFGYEYKNIFLLLHRKSERIAISKRKFIFKHYKTLKSLNKMIKVGINGFGRIGRFVFRAAMKRNDIQIVGINDLCPVDYLAYMLKYDTMHGQFDGTIEADVENSKLIVNGQAIRITAERNPADLKWDAVGAEYVVESTGLFLSKDKAQAHIDAGAKHVVISAPAGNDLKTIVYNVNHETLTKEDHIISAASCTTNCLAPMAKALNDLAPIKSGIMCTIHAYTGDQMTLDGPQRKGDLRRSRAAAVNIVPNSTGAAKAIGLVIPELNGKLIGSAQRVPTPTGSTTILTAVVEGNVTKEQINAAMKAASNESFGYNEDEIVSSDIVGMRFGSLFDATQTMVLPLENGTTEVQVVSWYDNENSYTSQMVRTIKHFGKLLNA